MVSSGISPQSAMDRRLAPVVLANEQLLAVPEPLLPLFPAGGLQRGWSIGVDGLGGWSLAMALLGPALDGDGWLACIGLEGLGLVAADELGLRLDRVLMIETPPPDKWATVIAALVEVVDVVCLGEGASVNAREGRRLMARAREQNAVLVHLDGGRAWPHALDVNLGVETGSWSGVGVGHGSLKTRSMTITATGRRSMAKPRQVDVLLPGPGGRLAPHPDVVARSAGERPGPVTQSSSVLEAAG